MTQQGGVRFFIPGLPEFVSDEELRMHFGRYGTIVDASVARERDGASKGFGYVTLDASSSPDALLNDIHPLGGKEIRVLLTKEALIGTDNKKVYIGNSDHLSQDEIRDAFMGFGQVWDVHTPKDPNSGVRKNFAFVTFAEVDSFERAVAMGGLEVKGQQVEIKPASKDGGKGKGKGDWGFDAWGWDGGKGWGGDFGAWGKGGGWGKAGAKSGAPALPAPEGMTYYVTNLPDPCQESDLSEHFGRYGKVTSARIAPGAGGARAYVTLEDGAQRDAILTDSHVVGGAQLSVMLSKDNLIAEDVKKVHLDNCAGLSPEAIREAFAQFGPILDVHCPKDAWSGERKRFSFVTFGDEGSMNRAIGAGVVPVEGQPVPVKAAVRSEAGILGDKGKAKGKGWDAWGKGDWWGADPWSWGKGDAWSGWGGDAWGKGGKNWSKGGGWGATGDSWGKGKGKGKADSYGKGWGGDWSCGKGKGKDCWGGRFGPY